MKIEVRCGLHPLDRRVFIDGEEQKRVTSVEISPIGVHDPVTVKITYLPDEITFYGDTGKAEAPKTITLNFGSEDEG